jgi:hypothetical protein
VRRASFFCTAFAAVPRHPWRGKIIVFDIMKTIKYLKKYKVGSIKTGGLIFYGSNCLVLFYKNFSTSYRYKKLGAIEDVFGLTAALGGGNV